MTYCKECLNKQQKINNLEEEIFALKSKLRYQERTTKEGFFGSSTPSAKIPVKPNSQKVHQRNRGGGKIGHQGHGRASICQEDADKVEKIHINDTCPDCGTTLEDKGTKTRTVMDCQPVKMKKVLYHLQRKRCPKCKKLISARPSDVLAKCLYSNQLLAYVAVHLLRTGKDLEKDFPENTEIKSFVQAPAPQLANAITLRTTDITDKQFKRQAAKIKKEIINITYRQAKHTAIQKIRDIFRETADRLYHWADDRNIPADNNPAERELRPLVIARKISFGSQSDAGAKTREILMTVLHTLKKGTPDVTTAFKSALDKLAEQSHIDPYKAIFSFDSS